jgi:hypothetical protein
MMWATSNSPPPPRTRPFPQNGWALASVPRGGGEGLRPRLGDFCTAEFSQFITILGEGMSKICDTFLLFRVVLSCPCFTESNSLFFLFWYLLCIIPSVPRTPRHCAPLRTVFRIEGSMFFFARGARLQATALRASHQTIVSVLGAWGGEELYVQKMFYLLPAPSKKQRNQHTSHLT